MPKQGAIWLIPSHMMPTPATGTVSAWMGTTLRIALPSHGMLKRMPMRILMRPTTKLAVHPAFHAVSMDPDEAATGSMMLKSVGYMPTVLMPYGWAVKSRPNWAFMRVAMCA